MQKTEIQGERLVWTVGNGDPIHGCVSHRVYLAHGNSKGEGRGKSGHKNSKRAVRNMEGRIVDTIGGESRKQGLISAKDLPIELPEGWMGKQKLRITQ